MYGAPALSVMPAWASAAIAIALSNVLISGSPPHLLPGSASSRVRFSGGLVGQVGQPGAEQPTGWRSQNQADDDEGQCHREFVPTALPRCWPAGQSGHAGHGVRWMAGDSLSAKVNSPPTCGR